MIDTNITARLARTIGSTMLLALFSGLTAVPASYSQTNPTGGTDVAEEGRVAVQRDPFWPVGYTPKWSIEKESKAQIKVMDKQEGTDWNKAMEQVVIQGVSSRAGNEFYAVINGQVTSTGETVSVAVGDVNYTWMIESISPPSSVQMRRVSAQ